MNDDNTWIRCLVVAFVTLVGCITLYNVSVEITKRITYSRSIDEATRAGRDPVQVGCAYGVYTSGDAAMCAINQVRP